jgi:acetyltransferase-like isoleucine patch superfamily enzyme
MHKLINTQLAKYAIIGTGNTAFSYSIYAAGIYIGLNYKTASLVGLLIGILFSFKTQGIFVFKNSDNNLIFKFIANWIILYLCMILFIKAFIDLGFSQYLAGIISLVPSTLLSFLSQKYFVFSKQNSENSSQNKTLPIFFYVKNIRHLVRRLFISNNFGKISYGRNSYGIPSIRWWGEEANVSIGKFCSIGKDVKIFLGGNHRADWVSTFPFPAFTSWKSTKGIRDYSITRGDVVIGNDVWIGEGCVILSGVRIGNGAIIGCYSVVTKDIPDYSVVAGNPAKLIRKRFSDADIFSLCTLQWWDWDQNEIDSALPEMLSSDVNKFTQKYIKPNSSAS